MAMNTRTVFGIGIFAFVAAAIGCSGRSTTITEIPIPNFDQTLGAYALNAGDSVVTGSGFSRQRGGGVVSCAGNTVYLMPDTDFYNWTITPALEETVDRTFGISTVMGTEQTYPVATRLAGEPRRFVKTNPCDIDGRFEFVGVPRGAYLVVTVITWLVPRVGQEGGPVFQRIRVDGTESLDVTLTNAS